MIEAGGNVLEDLKVMVELQRVDVQIHEIEKDKERLPRLVEYAGQALRDAQAECDGAEAALDAANKDKRTRDTELQTEGEHLRKLKLRSTEIKTNKEYFAHLKEIEDCQKKISKIEEESLELMEKVEQAEKAFAEKREALTAEQAKFSEAKEKIEGQFKEGDIRLAELKKAREELLPRLGKENAVYYNHIIRTFPDSAVVEARDGSCTGCRMTLPPQVFSNVRKGESIVTCNNCRRVLYYKEP
jgi:predicted  nucleic acid-binding Zn-ribbon protein